MKSESTWTAKVQRAISGFGLLAVKRGEGKWKKGSQIPSYVREYFLADPRGLIKDSAAVHVLNEKSKGAHSFTVTEQIPETESAYSKTQAKYGAPPHLDWDDAEYMGSKGDGVYYGALKKGGTWWALATVDSDTGSFTESLVAEGGYSSKKAAMTAAKDAAYEWCRTNRVECA
jgi:hypothetical protein